MYSENLIKVFLYKLQSGHELLNFHLALWRRKTANETILNISFRHPLTSYLFTHKYSHLAHYAAASGAGLASLNLVMKAISASTPSIGMAL